MTTRGQTSRSAQRNGHSSQNGAAPARRNGRVSAVAAVPPRKRTPVTRSWYRDAEQAARLQNKLGSKADRLDVEWTGEVSLQLSPLGNLMLSGPWATELVVDGLSLTVKAGWDSVCWNSDEDADYLELQLLVTDAVRIDRQILLSRRGGFALFADAVLAPSAKSIDYHARMTLAPGWRGLVERTTRECCLRTTGGQSRLFPLALPQQRVNAARGECFIEGDTLELKQSIVGSGLYAPLVFDWTPEHRRAPSFWRSLTVSETRQIVAPDVAAGYRLQVGREQWLVYRSLRNTGGARAVLGHHTFNETVIGRFEADGVKPLIAVE